MIHNTPNAAPSIAAQLASFAHDLEPGMLPAAVVERAKLLMLDALGIAPGRPWAARAIAPSWAPLRHCCCVTRC